MLSYIQKSIWNSISFENGVFYADDPVLRYISDEQSDEWLKISNSSLQTVSSEISIIKNKILDVINVSGITLVDFGCGDGNKASQLIKVLSQIGIHVQNYHAVDVNSLFIKTAITRVSASNQYFANHSYGHQYTFDEIAGMPNLPWEKHFHSHQDQLVYLFLGNTFNNFEVETIMPLLKQMTRNKGSVLLIGMKIRSTSSESEISTFLNDYEITGNSYTFSFGHLIGLKDDEMTRIVNYNSQLHRIEIWIQASHCIQHPILDGIKSDKILVLKSYKPTIEDILTVGEKLFSLVPWREKNNIVLYCK